MQKHTPTGYSQVLRSRIVHLGQNMRKLIVQHVFCYEDGDGLSSLKEMIGNNNDKIFADVHLR